MSKNPGIGELTKKLFHLWFLTMLLGAIIILLVCLNSNQGDLFIPFLLLFGGITLYILLTVLIYFNAIAHKRRSVAWVTASIVFSPLIAWIAYLLTWPETRTLPSKLQPVCDECGHKVKTTDKFCSNCGAEFEE